MTWFLILHLVNPYTTDYVIDTIPVHNEREAIDIKYKIETSSIYINAPSNKKGYVTILSKAN